LNSIEAGLFSLQPVSQGLNRSDRPLLAEPLWRQNPRTRLRTPLRGRKTKAMRGFSQFVLIANSLFFGALLPPGLLAAVASPSLFAQADSAAPIGAGLAWVAIALFPPVAILGLTGGWVSSLRGRSGQGAIFSSLPYANWLLLLLGQWVAGLS